MWTGFLTAVGGRPGISDDPRCRDRVPPRPAVVAPGLQPSILPAALLTVALLAGCGSSSLTSAPTQSPASPAINFTKPPMSGSTAPAQLAAGIYSVAWHASNGTATDCLFFMALIPTDFRPHVDPIPPNIFVDGNADSGTHDIPVSSAGMYLFEEVSGVTFCDRPWSADLTLTSASAPALGSASPS